MFYSKFFLLFQIVYKQLAKLFHLAEKFELFYFVILKKFLKKKIPDKLDQFPTSPYNVAISRKTLKEQEKQSDEQQSFDL